MMEPQTKREPRHRLAAMHIALTECGESLHAIAEEFRQGREISAARRHAIRLVVEHKLGNDLCPFEDLEPALEEREPAVQALKDSLQEVLQRRADIIRLLTEPGVPCK